MLAVSVLVIPALLLDNPRVHGTAHQIGTVLNVFTWAAFVVEFVVMLSVVPSRRQYMRDNPVQLIVVFLTIPFLEDVFDSLRILRILRVFRLFRLAPLVRWLFSAEGMRYAALAAVLITFAGGEAFAQLEGTGFWTGAYWSVTTITSTGSGNVAPITNEGKWLSATLMVIGLVIAAIVTGAVAERFLRRRTDRLAASDGEIISGEQQILAEISKLSSEIVEIRKWISTQQGEPK